MNKGDVFALSSGCYSDYGLNGFFRALQAFNITDEAKELKKQWPGERTALHTYAWEETPVGRKYVKLSEPKPFAYKDEAAVDDFAAYLTRKGLVENAEDIREYHCGDYGFKIPEEY